MPFEKGKEKTGGREKGVTNKATRDIKHVINKVLECTTDEDIKDVIDTLKADKPEALLSFWGKISPKDVNFNTKVTNDILEALNKNDINSVNTNE